LTFIAIAIASLIILYKFLKSGTLEPDKLDKLVDFFKTVVMTTALATVAYVITDLFKEREQDVKELEYFDKYVQEVKEVNGQGRLQLSKYLSIVAPSGEMKE
jgi:5,10-methenyltetrahydromethanopterin hydrogenase